MYFQVHKISSWLDIPCGVPKPWLMGQHNFYNYIYIKLHPYNNSFLCHWEARSQHCRWFQDLIATEFLGQQLVFFSDETQIKVYINVIIKRITDTGVFKSPHSLH